MQTEYRAKKSVCFCVCTGCVIEKEKKKATGLLIIAIFDRKADLMLILNWLVWYKFVTSLQTAWIWSRCNFTQQIFYNSILYEILCPALKNGTNKKTSIWKWIWNKECCFFMCTSIDGEAFWIFPICNSVNVFITLRLIWLQRSYLFNLNTNSNRNLINKVSHYYCITQIKSMISKLFRRKKKKKKTYRVVLCVLFRTFLPFPTLIFNIFLSSFWNWICTELRL